MEEPITVKSIKPKLIRFHNRKHGKNKEKLAWIVHNPTLNHVLQTHINMVKKIRKILPIQEVRVEYAKFDIQKLKNPAIQGSEYQAGRMKGYQNAPVPNFSGR